MVGYNKKVLTQFSKTGLSSLQVKRLHSVSEEQKIEQEEGDFAGICSDFDVPYETLKGL